MLINKLEGEGDGKGDVLLVAVWPANDSSRKAQHACRSSEAWKWIRNGLSHA